MRLIMICCFKVTSFVSLIIDGFGKPHAASATDGIRNSSAARVIGTCDVIAATRTSSRVELNTSDESTKAGRCLVLLKSVNGNGTKTMSPRL